MKNTQKTVEKHKNGEDQIPNVWHKQKLKR